MGMLEQMLIDLVITFLNSVVKNPGSVTAYKGIVHNIALAATEADTAASATVWTHTP